MLLKLVLGIFTSCIPVLTIVLCFDFAPSSPELLPICADELVAVLPTSLLTPNTPIGMSFEFSNLIVCVVII